MVDCLRRLVCIITAFVLACVLPTIAYARERNNATFSQSFQPLNSEYNLVFSANFDEEETEEKGTNEDSNYLIITNPTIVSDGREPYQLSAEDLLADTQTLLQTVLNSEYIRIARTSARLLSSEVEPLTVWYSDFNGYAELLDRSDLENVLISYIANAAEKEKEILLEMLQRNDMQNVLSQLGLARAVALCTPSEQSTYTNQSDAVRVYWGDEYGIYLTGQHVIYFSSGEQINAYLPSREYTVEEQEEVDSYYVIQTLQVTIIYSADISYNCHSYAWYAMDSNNPISIGVRKLGADGYQPGDDMFIPSTATEITSNYQIHDIVVYFNEYNHILHSAVIVEIDGDNIIVQSKWGQAGVYRHAISTVPREYLCSDGSLQTKVYRYHNVVHTVTDLGHSLRTHTYGYEEYCSVCGQIFSTYTTNVKCSGPPCYVPFSLNPQL